MRLWGRMEPGRGVGPFSPASPAVWQSRGPRRPGICPGSSAASGGAPFFFLDCLGAAFLPFFGAVGWAGQAAPGSPGPRAPGSPEPGFRGSSGAGAPGLRCGRGRRGGGLARFALSVVSGSPCPIFGKRSGRGPPQAVANSWVVMRLNKQDLQVQSVLKALKAFAEYQII
jgi:hypothetical protein